MFNLNVKNVFGAQKKTTKNDTFINKYIKLFCTLLCVRMINLVFK